LEEKTACLNHDKNIELQIRFFKKGAEIVTAVYKAQRPESREYIGFAPIGLDEPYRVIISEDPIGMTGGDINLYAYVGNNPVNWFDPWGLYWQYSQSTGQLIYVNNQTGATTTIGTGYSGNGAGLNNPNMQNAPNVGPIPQGDWTIGTQRNNTTNSGHNLPASMRLTPQTATNTFNRDGFLIHGDNDSGNQSASEGCVILNRTIRNRIGNSGDNTLRVVQ